jgi:hypothetical protein
LDYLRTAGVKPDERVADAVEMVEKSRDENGRWPLHGFHFERVTFDMEACVGPSQLLEHAACASSAELVSEARLRDDACPLACTRLKG